MAHPKEAQSAATPAGRKAPVGPGAGGPAASGAQAEPPLRVISASEPPALAPAALPKLDPNAVWPGNVPSLAHALTFIGEQTLPAERFVTARRFQETLTALELEVVRSESLAPSLRDAIGIRWRLSAAKDLLPGPQDKMDVEALNDLLASVDRSLDALRSMELETPEMGLLADRTCELLTKLAVDLSEWAHARATPLPAEPAARKPAPGAKRAGSGPKKAAARKAAQGSARRPQRKIGMWIALSIAVALAAAYHGYDLIKPPADAPAVPGAPAGLLITRNPKTGGMAVSTESGGPPTPEHLQWIEQQKAQGFKVVELGQGAYILSPADPAGRPAQ